MGNQENCNSMFTEPPSAINGGCSCSFYPQEFKKQDALAAILLFSFQFCKLDDEIAQKLEKQRKRKPQIIIKQQQQQQQQQQQVPWIPGLEGQIGKCSERIEKLLTDSDVKDNQTRLLLNKEHVKALFYPLLSKDELDKLKGKKASSKGKTATSKGKKGISVNVYDSEGRKYEMVFRLWGDKAHVLTSKNWIHFCNDHKLKSQKDWVSLWMFKLKGDDQKLCFYITSRRIVDEKQRDDVSVVGDGCGSKKRKRCGSKKRKREDAVN